MSDPKVFEFETGEGITLRCLRPNRFELWKLERHFLNIRPQPPKVVTETAFGEEDVDNPADLDYRVELMSWQETYSMARVDFMIEECVLNDPPEDMSDIERTYDRLARRGVSAPYDLSDPDERKVAWVRHILRGPESGQFADWLSRIAGVTEGEVEEAEKK